MMISSRLIRSLIRHRLIESVLLEKRLVGSREGGGVGEVLQYLQGKLQQDSRNYLRLEQILGVLLEGVEEDWLRRVCKYIVYNLVRTNTGLEAQEMQGLGNQLGYREEFNNKKPVKNIKDLNISEILKGCLIYCRKDEDRGVDSQKVKVMQQHLKDKLGEIKEIFEGDDEFVGENDIVGSGKGELGKMRGKIRVGDVQIDDAGDRKKYLLSDLPAIKAVITGFFKKKKEMQINYDDKMHPIVLAIDNIFGQILNQGDRLRITKIDELLKHLVDIKLNLNRLDDLSNKELKNLYEDTFHLAFDDLIKSLQSHEYNRKTYHDKKSKKNPLNTNIRK